MADALKGFNIDLEDGEPDGEEQAQFMDQAAGGRIFMSEASCLQILEDYVVYEEAAAAQKRQSAPVARPAEMPINHKLSSITPTEVLRWETPRIEEANRWEPKPESEKLDRMVLEAYCTPVGHWNFFHSRSTTPTAPPNDPPCGREAPQGRIDKREYVVARSVEEGIRVLETDYCKDLDFTSNAVMSHKDVGTLQSPFRGDDAKADYSKTATTQALAVRKPAPHEERDLDRERKDTEAISRLRQLQAPAVKLIRLVGTNPTIRTLRIDCKHLGEAAFCALAAALETNTSLRVLDCGNNHLTPHAAALLGFSLRNHELEELYLDWCHVGSSGAYHLCSSLYGNSSLRLLRC
jgi:hypothetical protein